MATTIGVKLYCREQKGDFESWNSFVTTGSGTTEKTPEQQVADEVEEILSTDATVNGIQLYGVQNIGDLQGAPSTIDVTSLEDYEEQSEPGLISGSSIAIVFNYKAGVYAPASNADANYDYSNFEKCLDLSSGDKINDWVILLPNGRWFAFQGRARTTVTGMAVASAQQYTMTLYKRSKVFTGFEPQNAKATSQVDMVAVTKSAPVPQNEEQDEI